ncbi:Zeta-carotene desaturase /chromoplastic [Citrus sinensis]|uniref:Zeta-carotene desaturase /chromoplastic n=1 Tax=Citrus sinensis TaxID=2711 RepID=A0ACB8KII8_CITSI|nr:Zeta-carotene desaturase /chromoplastic [Citrus sinensis]
MGSSVLFPATSVTGVRWSRVQVKGPRFRVRASLDTNVSDMSVKEPEHYRGPKLKVAIIGAGLAGMSTAVELLDQGHEVDIYELRSFIGGKVASFVGKHGNHIEISLHIFFGCCNNLFRLTKKVGADENLLMKDHTHKFVNKGGEIGELDFRFPIGAPLHGIRAFLSTNQLKTYDKSRNAIALALSPVVKALLDPDGAFDLLILFVFSDDQLIFPTLESVLVRTGSILGGDAERCIMINLLTGKHLSKDLPCLRQLRQAVGLDNLLYTPDADFSCFADLALTSPEYYYREGQGSFLQCVLTPGDPYMPLPNDEIIRRVAKQDYIDSMEGATLSGRRASGYICNAGEELVALRKQLAAFESLEQMEAPTTANDELSLV